MKNKKRIPNVNCFKNYNYRNVDSTAGTKMYGMDVKIDSAN